MPYAWAPTRSGNRLPHGIDQPSAELAADSPLSSDETFSERETSPVSPVRVRSQLIIPTFLSACDLWCAMLYLVTRLTKFARCIVLGRYNIPSSSDEEDVVPANLPGDLFLRREINIPGESFATILNEETTQKEKDCTCKR